MSLKILRVEPFLWHVLQMGRALGWVLATQLKECAFVLKGTAAMSVRLHREEWLDLDVGFILPFGVFHFCCWFILGRGR